MTPEEQNKLLIDALKQMLGAFDNPVARRKLDDQWSNDSRKFAADIYEQVTGHRHQER